MIGSSPHLPAKDEDILQAKQRLRKQCLATRKSLGAETRAGASLSICKNVESWNIFQQCQTILTYMPIKSEADPTPLLKLYSHKKWVIPRIIPEEDHRMVFHPYDPNHLIQHPFGMAEPAPDLPVMQPEAIELTLAPGLAFDKHGFRLGYGGGYFDRFLNSFKGISVGITFHALFLDTIPHAAHDIPMHWVVTERELIKTN